MRYGWLKLWEKLWNIFNSSDEYEKLCQPRENCLINNNVWKIFHFHHTFGNCLTNSNHHTDVSLNFSEKAGDVPLWPQLAVRNFIKRFLSVVRKATETWGYTCSLPPARSFDDSDLSFSHYKKVLRDQNLQLQT